MKNLGFLDRESSPLIILAVLSERIRLNLHALITKITAAFVRIVPFRPYVVEAMGLLMGTALLFLNTGKWRTIAGFAESAGSGVTGWRYVIRHFMQRGADSVWTNLFYEIPDILRKYIEVENVEALTRAVGTGKGVVLLGIHVGPTIAACLLLEMNMDVKWLVLEESFNLWKRAAKSVIQPLRGRKITFLSDPRRNLIAGKAEKQLVQHLKGGGTTFMKIDLPGTLEKELSAGQHVSEMGVRFRPHHFPFRLSLRYGSPVFFCFFEKVRHGYRLHFTPCEEFSTSHEGFLKHISFLKEQSRTRSLFIES